MNNELLAKISEKQKKLEFIKIELKKKFIGIDDVIDKIIDNMSLWYLTPEIQFRPLIISLWGITGVGKTDLVRTLVKLLEFTDKFVEVQLDMKNDYSRNIENYLESSGIDSKEPSILLLDEIQRFRTIDEQGKMIENKYFNDIWMLLSDGKFQNNSERKREIMELMMEEMYYQDRRDEDENDVEDVVAPSDESSDTSSDNKKVKKKPKNYRFKTSYWTANRFKRMLNLEISAEKIMEMSLEERMKMMENSLKAGNVNEGKVYEKILIFISGNIDEAFNMSDDVEDSESDADILCEVSKRVNFIDIKSALLKKFKPEQIARFGNNHVIYPCLNKKSYEKIIKMNCQEIINRLKKEHGFNIKLSQAIYDVIYNNGVFPAQGVRPTISTIFNVLGSNLPHFLYHALINDVKKIELDLDYENRKFFTKINDRKIEKTIVLDVDDIRDDRSIDEIILIAAHEIGHALIYALVFKTPPKQININSSGLAKGFVINHNSIDNKTFIKNQITVYLAGLVAEELVFGEEFKSNGARSDILFATDIAGRYIRSYGMDRIISNIIRKEADNSNSLNYDIEQTDSLIEGMLSNQKKIAKDLIEKNVGVYKKLLNHAIANKSITIQNFLNICNENGMKLIQKEINDKLIYSYEKKLNKFLNQ